MAAYTLNVAKGEAGPPCMPGSGAQLGAYPRKRALGELYLCSKLKRWASPVAVFHPVLHLYLFSRHSTQGWTSWTS